MKNINKVGFAFAVVLSLSGCGEPVEQSNVESANKEFVSAVSGVAATATESAKQETFADVMRNLRSPAFGGVDAINGMTSPKTGAVVPITGDKVEIAGNYVDAVNADAAAGVLVLIDGNAYVTIYGGERPDIAKALNNPKYLQSQFYVSIPTAEIGVGQHEVKVRVIASDRSGYYDSDWKATLDIK